MRAVKWLALRAPALYLDSGWELPKLQLHRDHDLVAYRKKAGSTGGESGAARMRWSFRATCWSIESENDGVIPHTVITSYVEACTQAYSAHLPHDSRRGSRLVGREGAAAFVHVAAGELDDRDGAGREGRRQDRADRCDAVSPAAIDLGAGSASQARSAAHNRRHPS